MNETMVCAVGNVATQPVFREAVTGPSARFRIAVTARHWDREKSVWVDGHTSFYTVWAGRRLAANVSASLSVGDPVIVQGRLKVRSELREGQQTWTSADIDAVAIGHDLARGTSAFRRASRPEPGTGAGAGTGAEAGAEISPEPNWEIPAEGSSEASTAPPPEVSAEGPPEPSADASAKPAQRKRREPVPAG
ncbi:single-stranded DNA-binding protein [Streptomyces mangrovisoli]|uniref:Single-stranded DNA-binding protein n=1 Tax=Streptomyces mangrovisoli TaxID=1428628 RepID=A0A1J4P456_9ACTN|nr:single-stranded DNA-binding protein [Streptomyces mangrovisoli]OIJ69379.1 single-stranded DNA-binding protein [Streptomyces mangrovisoli]